MCVCVCVYHGAFEILIYFKGAVQTNVSRVLKKAFDRYRHQRFENRFRFAIKTEHQRVCIKMLPWFRI